jgi:hypothetical protein
MSISYRAGVGDWWRYKVFLNGERVENVLSADDNKVVRIVKSARGIVDIKKPIPTEILLGKVELRPFR